MKLILLSGGSGKRLWPLSNEVRSKQFLKLLHNSSGEPLSMVQKVWRQLASCQWAEKVYISTNSAHVDLIHSQIGTEVPLIIEPQKKDTFPAIALAATYLHSREGVGMNDVVTVIPVDSCVDERFWAKVRELEEALGQSGADIALLGVTPTYASTKYGYIVPLNTQSVERQTSSYKRVGSFKEKPTPEVAQQLVEQQALWNCGVFSFQLGYMLRELEKKGLPTDYEQLLAAYDQLAPISFDYEVLEKAQQVVVVPFDGAWKDLGTWNTLTEEMNAPTVGRVYLDADSSNTHVINELDIPVVALSTSDMIVAASPDGILVSPKEKSHLVKNLSLEWERRAMYEEKRWGWYHVLYLRNMEEKGEVLTKFLHVHAGKNLSYQYHHQRSEVWTIIEGEGEFILNDRLMRVVPGDVLTIPALAKHAIRATKDLGIIEVQMGSKLIEEDIVRVAMTWEETLLHVRTGGSKDGQ